MSFSCTCKCTSFDWKWDRHLAFYLSPIVGHELSLPSLRRIVLLLTRSGISFRHCSSLISLLTAKTVANAIVQHALGLCFPNFLGLRRPTEEKYTLRHPVVNPQQFALRFGYILKIVFLMTYWKRINSRHPCVLHMASRLRTTALGYTFQIRFVDIRDCLGHQQCSQLCAVCEKRSPP